MATISLSCSGNFDLVTYTSAFVVQTSIDVQRNLTESVLRAMKYLVDGVFPVIEAVHGYTAEFYIPVTEGSVYGDFSDLITYQEAPDFTKRVTITGIPQDRYESGDALDNYFGPNPVVYMCGDYPVKEKTKIKVLMRTGNYITFQVINSFVFYGMDDAIIRKMMVSAVAGG